MEFTFDGIRFMKKQVLELIYLIDFLDEFMHSMSSQFSEVVRVLREKVMKLVLKKKEEDNGMINYEQELLEIEDKLGKVLFKVRMLRETFRKEVRW